MLALLTATSQLLRTADLFAVTLHVTYRNGIRRLGDTSGQKLQHREHPAAGQPCGSALFMQTLDFSDQHCCYTSKQVRALQTGQKYYKAPHHCNHFSSATANERTSVQTRRLNPCKYLAEVCNCSHQKPNTGVLILFLEGELVLHSHQHGAGLVWVHV